MTSRLTILTLLLTVGCLSYKPLIREGKVVTEPSGEPKVTTSLSFSPKKEAKETISSVLDSKGYQKPKPVVDPEKDKQVWRNLTYASAGLGAIFLVLWYLGKGKAELGGLSVIFGILALTCAGVNAILGWAALIPIGLLTAALIWVGYRIHNKGIFK